MSVSQLENGAWRCQIDRKDMPRVRKTFKSEYQALAFEDKYIRERQEQKNKDRRTLKDLIELWYDYHGSTLSEGIARKNTLIEMAAIMKNPIAAELTPEQVLKLRAHRLQTIKPKTWNNNLGLLKSVYNRLRKLKIIDYENPINGVDPLRLQEEQLSYLSKDEISRLLDEIQKNGTNKDTWWVAQLCFRTGARWGEVEQMQRKQLRDAKLTFVRTKSKKARSVPIDPAFYHALLVHIGKRGSNDRVFCNCAKAFEHAIGRSNIELPEGQLTHICRHSFSAHFMMNGGNILTLQKILGHADIKMTLRYAQLAPEYLADAIKYAPI
ncbi:Site-specific recombinase XerD [Thiothrix eikelboomii]|uniref:Site-specific recombinase XerD n=1 Tax=Thiothrix eikelboomii TaxID=92487 RepID=A0A1T4XNE6_9GAMM|nr:tyrosine-type recombinase/integrase [Thiothrix eikelboomii]SKA91054.1 Site-specific recombinase XerD [Thiothrix eikelboomii]